MGHGPGGGEVGREGALGLGEALARALETIEGLLVHACAVNARGRALVSLAQEVAGTAAARSRAGKQRTRAAEMRRGAGMTRQGRSGRGEHGSIHSRHETTAARLEAAAMALLLVPARERKQGDEWEREKKQREGGDGGEGRRGWWRCGGAPE